jgi:hypothetical protein
MELVTLPDFAVSEPIPVEILCTGQVKSLLSGIESDEAGSSYLYVERLEEQVAIHFHGEMNGA